MGVALVESRHLSGGRRNNASAARSYPRAIQARPAKEPKI